MTLTERLTFRVGKTEKHPGYLLAGARYIPRAPRAVAGFFTPGWSATWEDYWPLLQPLAEEHIVYTFNLRGHGGSEGTLDPDASASDIREVAQFVSREHPQMRKAFLGHSLATLTLATAQDTRPDAIVLYQPYVSTALLPGALRAGISLLGRMRGRKLLDDLAGKLPLRKAGLNMRRPLENTAALAGFSLTARADVPVLYFLADRDRVLGTQDPKRYSAYKATLDRISTVTEDASDLVKGLNHCFNYHGFTPFLKKESGKDSQAIIDRTIAFIDRPPETAPPRASGNE